MSTVIASAIVELEQELEVAQERCADLARAIETLRPLAGDVVARNGKKPAATNRTDGRTDGRSKNRARV